MSSTKTKVYRLPGGGLLAFDPMGDNVVILQAIEQAKWLKVDDPAAPFGKQTFTEDTTVEIIAEIVDSSRVKFAP